MFSIVQTASALNVAEAIEHAEQPAEDRDRGNEQNQHAEVQVL